MRVLIFGHTGQLGRALLQHIPSAAGASQPEVNITQPEPVKAVVDAARPDVIIHCAAMTDVDGAARNPQLAYQVNGLGTQNVAQAAARVGAALVYVSTNEVFDGAGREPYFEFDAANPINAYGRSKFAGEWFVSHLTARFYIVRTAWLTGAHGRNFAHRIQQLADERGRLEVVTDEVSNPTFAGDLAQAIVHLMSLERFGIYHLTNAGYCSRYEFARKLLELSGRGHVPIEPTTLAQYRRASTPPPFTPLANTAAAALGITLRPWEEALKEFLGA